ncbi:hypothetical protein MIDIC_50074 [Alphaproteobacteria bacterium]
MDATNQSAFIHCSKVSFVLGSVDFSTHGSFYPKMLDFLHALYYKVVSSLVLNYF